MKNVLNRCTSYLIRQLYQTWSIYFLSSFILLTAGCNKSNETPPLTPNFNVYMAGTLDGKAVYWKNGSPIILNNNGEANAIVVNGSDVYVCGTVNSDKTLATYWKNGKEVSLETQDSSDALGMAIQGGNVYIVGWIEEPGSVFNAVYWKNDVLYYLSPATNSFATGIMVSGQQIYISGNAFGAFDSAVIWKNGERGFFAQDGFMNAVGFNGTDTFYVGTQFAAPTYWINNKMIPLYINGYTSAVAFSGSDVYVGGGVRPNLNNNYAAIWKNDSLTIFTDKYVSSTVSGIGIAGSDVYAVGYVSADYFTYIPVYWKNGVMVKLGDSGTVSGISIGQ
jgi:hypothetical protein